LFEQLGFQLEMGLHHYYILDCYISIPTQHLQGLVQHLANKVGSVIVKHNRDDMKEIRETIVEENEMCGFETNLWE
jgi:hypothetical protein